MLHANTLAYKKLNDKRKFALFLKCQNKILVSIIIYNKSGRFGKVKFIQTDLKCVLELVRTTLPGFVETEVRFFDG